jgi:hypothetical protein
MSTLTSLQTGTVVPYRQVPVVVPVADPTYGVVGSVITLSGQQSSDPSAQPSRSGTDSSTVASGNTINAASGNFTSLDIDRVITLTGVDAGSYLITGVNGPTQVVVSGLDGSAVVFNGGANAAWSITDTLTFNWSFVAVPIGSQVALEGFRLLEPDGSSVSFSPDIVGEYVIGLTVANSVFTSVLATCRTSIRAILVPHARGIIPDGKFIFTYIRDVWTQVENSDLFATFWSALIQIIGGELLKLYQNDFNKSIRDIQDLYQRRWIDYSPRLDLVEADLTFYICNTGAGQNATTQNLGLQGLAIIISASEVLIVQGSVLPNVAGVTFTITFDSRQPSNIHDYILAGTNTSKTGYKIALSSDAPPDPGPDLIFAGAGWQFAFRSTTWTLNVLGPFDYAEAMSETPSPIDVLGKIFGGESGTGAAENIHVGDYIYYPGGPNAGIYKIITKSGTFVTVDHPPPGASDNTVGAVLSNVYRAVGFEIDQADQVTSNTLAIPFDPTNDLSVLAPGRVVIVNGQAYTVLRAQFSQTQTVPVVIITTVSGDTILTGLSGLTWRVPDTLISKSQNFEELGVSPGDLLVLDVINSNDNSTSEVAAQVVGVDGFALGFLLTDQPLTAGVPSPIPNHTYESLSSDLGISSVTVNPNGTLNFSGDAQAIINFVTTGIFHNQFCNVPLTNQTNFAILGGNFTIHFKRIIRNQKIPVDTTLKSVPLLQDWIVQPQISQHDGGIFQVKNGVEYPLTHLPYSLVENSDFTVDNEVAFHDLMTFATGTNIIFVENGRFIDKGLVPGDEFIINDPVTLAGTYFISAVLSQQELELSRAVPLYVLGTVVTANVEILRSKTGNFLRFIPGGFTPAHPAPDRLWAEVSLYDNWDSVENNFGILVGLTRADLEAVSANANYRQAVAGLMFAFVNGPIINKIRLGAQILLGLPFAENQGIIRSIENDYRLDVNGNPILGRILIEDTDSTNTPLGTLRVYTFPIDPASQLAGIENNPATGKPFAVGDSVQLFAILSKGVEVDDYITKPELAGFSAVAQIQQFQAMRMRANDTIFTLAELGLVSSFLSKITPSYIAFILASDAEFADSVSVLDALTLKLGSEGGSFLVDNASLQIPSATVFDGRTFSGYNYIRFDDGVFWIRLSGRDLSTTYSGSSTQAFRAAGGLMNPPNGEGPVTRVGDKLFIIDGPNLGTYTVTTVSDDQHIVVSGLPASGFQTAIQHFAIARPIVAQIRSGLANVASGNPQITVEVGLTADGVAPNDIIAISYHSGFTSLHTIVQVGGPGQAIAAGKLNLSPTPTATDASASYNIYRKSIIESPFVEVPGTITSNGSSYTAISAFLQVLIEVGDELQVQDPTLNRLVALDPMNLGFVPVLAAGTYNVLLCKKKHPSSPIGWDHINTFDPFDLVDVSLYSNVTTSAICLVDNNDVTLEDETSTMIDPITQGMLPGDLLVLLNGGNSTVDVGYGPGIYPIMQVFSDHVQLQVLLTSSDPSAWKVLRRR